MYASTAVADEILRTALEVVRAGDRALREALDELPAAIYVTDADGFVTYFNPACIGFTGRMPVVRHMEALYR
jgi:PAS domain-containing protein